MNRQEIFDKAAAHLLTQQRQSVNTKGICLYRGPWKYKCAVGALIPDYMYDKKMEGVSVGSITDGVPEECSDGFKHGHQMLADALVSLGIEIEDWPFLIDLQSTHDNNSGHLWAEELFELADEYNLDPSVAMAYALEIE